MKIVRAEGGEYSDCIVKYFDLMDFDDNKLDSVLFWGWQCIERKDIQQKYHESKKKYFINTAQPCDIINGYNDIIKQFYFDEVFTICPYTANILNTQENKTFSTKYTPICFPFRQKYFDKYKSITINDKVKDVIYYGNLHHNLYDELIKTISKYNYAFASPLHHNPNKPITQEMIKMVTHINLPSIYKWDLLSKSKISVGFNLLFLSRHHIHNLKTVPNIESFENIQKTFDSLTMPQMKTRMVEAAACKTLMLIYKDDWNVIEKWFKPNEHFLYWSSFEQLKNLINDISFNYEKYWPIVEAANKHVQQYSIENLIKKINKNETF